MMKWVSRASLTLDECKFRLPLYLSMLVDRTADYYMISKSSLMRNLIDNAKGLDELHNFYRLPEHLDFFNKPTQIYLKLNREDLIFLSDLSEHLEISRNKTLECIILSGIDKLTRIMDESKMILPNARKRFQLRSLYVNRELHDSFCEIRDDRGESISLLLKEAVSGFNKRVTDPINRFAKEKMMNLRLLPEEWDKLDIIANASKLDTAECVASIMADYYGLERDYGESA